MEFPRLSGETACGNSRGKISSGGQEKIHMEFLWVLIFGPGISKG